MKNAMDPEAPPYVLWWLKGQERQNFGDFLTQLLWDTLVEEPRIRADIYRLIGSAIDDWIVENDLNTIGRWERGRIAFWCCGLRDDKPLNADSRARSVFCGVRGPLTRDRLGLASATPMGDPALLLPLFHTPSVSERTKGRTVCAPHFHDASSEENLLESTGADVIVRPGVANDHDAIVDVINDLASAEFVLAGSLHAAIVACAYGVPFCYFDAGHVDIPFKWRDFSASINVGTFFVDNVADGRNVFDTAIEPRLTKPLLFPILAAAPFRARAEYLMKAALSDAAQLEAGGRIDKDAFSAFVEVANQDLAAIGSQSYRLDIADLSAKLHELRELGRECNAAKAALAQISLRASEFERERDSIRDALEDANRRSTELERERDEAQSALSDANSRAASRERERDAFQIAWSESETRAHDRERERDEALASLDELNARVVVSERKRDDTLARLSKAEGRAANIKVQRDNAFALWQAQVASLRQDQDYLARYLARTYQRPWRPFKHAVLSSSLTTIGTLVSPLAPKMSARFKSSARKRRADRFDGFLSSTPTREAMTRLRDAKFNMLYFSPFPSHPSNHGNQATIQQFGKRFQALGHRVHFALLQSEIFDAEAERAMREAWDTFDIVPNTKQPWADGSEIPFDGWYDQSLGEEVRFLCAVYDIDLVFCSYVFQSKLLESVPSHILKVIDTHDKMGDRYQMLRQNGQPLEFFSCTPEEEGDYLRRADIVVARRDEEARYFDSVTGRDNAIVIPHVEEAHYLNKRFHCLENVGIVASANQINLAIVLEFLGSITRRSPEPPFTVHIAGEIKDMVKNLDPKDAKAFTAPWVRMHGFVHDIEDFYRQMDAIVAPVTMGTGINVKTVQAMAYGMPLLTTKIGGKGIETDEPMHRFVDLDSLVADLLSLVDRPKELNRLASVSRDRYHKFYLEARQSIDLMFAHPKLQRRRS